MNRVRENSMHCLMREGRREPVLYSTRIDPESALLNYTRKLYVSIRDL